MGIQAIRRDNWLVWQVLVAQAEWQLVSYKGMKTKEAQREITKVFKPYIVKRTKGQCQILIPLVELDALVNKIVAFKSKGE